jgi:hypothetical protein
VSGFLYKGLYWLSPDPVPEDDYSSDVGDLWDRYQRQHPQLIPVIEWPNRGRHLVVASGREKGVSRGDWVTHSGILIGRVDATTRHLSRVLTAGSQHFRVAALVREMDPETGIPGIVGRVLLRGAWEGVLRAETSNGLRAVWDGHAVFCADNEQGEEWLIGYVRRDERLGEWVVRLSADDVDPDAVQIETFGSFVNPADVAKRRAMGVILSGNAASADRASYLVRLSKGDAVVNGDAVLLDGGIVGRVVRAGGGTCRFRLFRPSSMTCSGLALQVGEDGEIHVASIATVASALGMPAVTRGFEDRLPRGLPLNFRSEAIRRLQPGVKLTFVGSNLSAELKRLMGRSS